MEKGGQTFSAGFTKREDNLTIPSRNMMTHSAGFMRHSKSVGFELNEHMQSTQATKIGSKHKIKLILPAKKIKAQPRETIYFN